MKVESFLGFISLQHASNIIGCLTCAVCLTEIVFFSLYFTEGNGVDRSKI